jgi:hypothetical protein
MHTEIKIQVMQYDTMQTDSSLQGVISQRTQTFINMAEATTAAKHSTAHYTTIVTSYV